MSADCTQVSTPMLLQQIRELGTCQCSAHCATTSALHTLADTQSDVISICCCMFTVHQLTASVRSSSSIFIFLCSLSCWVCRLLVMICRHTHLQQQLHLEDVQLLHPLKPAKRSVDSIEASSHSSSSSDPSSSIGLDECGNTANGVEGTGVTHVGLLRAGSVRHVVAGLADGQLLMYRENGVWPHICPHCSLIFLLKLLTFPWGLEYTPVTG